MQAEQKIHADSTPGRTLHEKFQNCLRALQVAVNCLYDGDLDKSKKDKLPGCRQRLEKKEGLFRMHMMGKRVDFAARSVISPDPFIRVDEIGVPEIFAKKLTFAEPVSHFNLRKLREMVINGPDKYPGASFVVDDKGHKVMLHPDDRTQREAIAKRLLVKDPDNLGGTKVVRSYEVLLRPQDLGGLQYFTGGGGGREVILRIFGA